MEYKSGTPSSSYKEMAICPSVVNHANTGEKTPREQFPETKQKQTSLALIQIQQACQRNHPALNFCVSGKHHAFQYLYSTSDFLHFNNQKLQNDKNNCK